LTISKSGTRVPNGTHPKWEACTACGSLKVGKQRSFARCRSCSHKRPKFNTETGLWPCRNCGIEKPAGEFVKTSFISDGRDTICKQCKNAGRIGEYQRFTREQQDRRRAAVLRNKYGVAPELVQMLYEQQEGCCAICGKPGDPPHVGDKRVRQRSLNIDHDHTPGEIRGLLCMNCNSGLGHFNDSLHKLVRAAAYLGRSE
jgi:hypothetical protein